MDKQSSLCMDEVLTCACVVLLHDEGVAVDVEGELLAVQGDEDGAGHVVRDLVRDLLTERVHVVVADVVVGVVHPGDGQSAPRHLGLDLLII